MEPGEGGPRTCRPMNISGGIIPCQATQLCEWRKGVEWRGRGMAKRRSAIKSMLIFFSFFPSFLLLLLSSSLLTCIHPFIPSSLHFPPTFGYPLLSLSSSSSSFSFYISTLPPLLALLRQTAHTQPLEFDSHSSLHFFLLHFGTILLTPPFFVVFTPHFFDLLSNTPHTYTYSLLILALAPVSL